MHNSRLVLLLKTLTPKEIREFRKYINSPYFNQRTDVIQLFESLVNFIFKMEMIPDKPFLFHQIYPNEKFDDLQFRLLFSYCFKKLEQFLVAQMDVSDKIKNQIKLSRIYRERNLPKHFQSSLKKAQNLQQKHLVRNAEYYTNHTQILLEEYHFTSSSQRTGAQNLQEISDNIDITFFTQKLRQICFSLSHQTIYKTEYNFGMLKEMIHYIETQNLLHIPAIAVYYYGYYAMIQPDKIHYYEKLKALLFQYANHFPAVEIRDLFLMTINLSIKRLNEGDKRIVRELLDLYKEGLKREYLLNNAILSRFTHRNIITIGLIQKDYNWVENFILSYKDRIEEQFQKSSYTYNMARLEYARKNYATVLKLLQKSDYTDLLLNLDAKVIALKTYYDLKEISLLESHMDAMKKFIRRKKIIGYHQENYLNLIAFTKQLLELKSYDKISRQQLQTSIQSTKAVAEKEWLLNHVK